MSYMYLSNGDMAILKRKIYMLILMLLGVFVLYEGLSNVEGQKCKSA